MENLFFGFLHGNNKKIHFFQTKLKYVKFKKEFFPVHLGFSKAMNNE